LPSAGSTTTLDIPFTIKDRKVLKGLEASVRWDPIDVAFAPVAPAEEVAPTDAAAAPAAAGTTPAATPATPATTAAGAPATTPRASDGAAAAPAGKSAAPAGKSNEGDPGAGPK